MSPRFFHFLWREDDKKVVQMWPCCPARSGLWLKTIWSLPLRLCQYSGAAPVLKELLPTFVLLIVCLPRQLMYILKECCGGMRQQRVSSIPDETLLMYVFRASLALLNIDSKVIKHQYLKAKKLNRARSEWSLYTRWKYQGCRLTSCFAAI